MPREPGSLEFVQTALLALITGREAGPSAPDPEALVVSDARGGARERLHVYAHMYRARMVEALETQFPRLARHLGPDDFADLCAAYVSDEPSTQPSLRSIGERLPAWLAARRPEAPSLAALARLEWARADVFDVVDEPVLTIDELRSWPADRFAELPLRLIAAHRFLTTEEGTADRWTTVGTGGATDDRSSGATDESLLVWRQGVVVYHRPLPDAERAALELAARGTQLGVVCEMLLGSLGDEGAVAQAFAWLSTWVADGLVVHP